VKIDLIDLLAADKGGATLAGVSRLAGGKVVVAGAEAEFRPDPGADGGAVDATVLVDGQRITSRVYLDKTPDGSFSTSARTLLFA